MSNLQLWSKAGNYIGEDYSDYYIGPGKSRDSDLLTQSNFDVALEMLGGEQENDTVVVARSSHWGCGWGEQILVRKDCIQVNMLERIRFMLEDYPVLDEDHYGALECSEMADTFEAYENEFTKTVADYLGIENNDETGAELSTVAHVIFEEDSDWHGFDDAWVNDDSIQRASDSYEISELAKAGNSVAWLLITKELMGAV